MTDTIVFLDHGSLAPGTVLRPPAFAHQWIDHDETKPGEVAARIKDATIVVSNKIKVGAAEMDAAPGLKLIAVCATGTELRDLYGTRLAVVGRGSLGQGVATIAKGFGMEVVFVGRKGDAAPDAPLIPWDEAIETADVLTLHCPLTPETRGMIGLDEFQRMKRTALVINTARGGLIDEDALVQALTEGLIAGAGMDVVSSEPPPAEHPFMALVGRPDFILTPHTAWAGNTARAAMAEQLIRNIENFKNGTPANIV